MSRCEHSFTLSHWNSNNDCPYCEIDRLTAELENLREATKGKTFFHSDDAVNDEMGKLRRELAEANKYIEILKTKPPLRDGIDPDLWCRTYDRSERYREALEKIANDKITLSTLPTLSAQIAREALEGENE